MNWTPEQITAIFVGLTGLIAAITALIRTSRTEGKVDAQGERQKGQAESIRQVRDIATKTAADLIPPDAAAMVWESVARKAVEEYLRKSPIAPSAATQPGQQVTINIPEVETATFGGPSSGSGVGSNTGGEMRSE